MKTIKINAPRVRNMYGHSGNPVVNQFEIYGPDFRAFQSYQSVIVLHWKDGKTYLDYSKWDYSTTTGKYRNKYLMETKKETEAKIKSGEYILAELNG